MSEPSTFSLAGSAASCGLTAWMLRQLISRLPRWRSRRLVYRIPDPTEVEKPDLWCCRIGRQHYLTSSKTTLELRMDLAQLAGDSVGPVSRVRWHGRVRTDTPVGIGRGDTAAEAVAEALGQLVDEQGASELQKRKAQHGVLSTR